MVGLLLLEGSLFSVPLVVYAFRMPGFWGADCTLAVQEGSLGPVSWAPHAGGQGLQSSHLYLFVLCNICAAFIQAIPLCTWDLPSLASNC